MNFRRVVTIGGPPGSGKTTAGRRVAATLGLDYRSAGDRFRAEAAARGLSLADFGRYAQAHPEVDRELDRAMQELATPGRLIDGRIQGALCRRAGRPVFAVGVTAREEVRVHRVAARDGQSVDDARRAIREREASERARYLAFYGIDLDLETADLVVDSSERDADGVAREIVAFLHRREGAA